MIGAVGFRFVRGIIKSAVLSSNESTWDYWQRSMSKTDIVCMYDKGNDVLLTLGEIKLVMTTMVTVMMVTMMMMMMMVMMMIAHDECYDVFVLIMMMIIDYDFYDIYD